MKKTLFITLCWIFSFNSFALGECKQLKTCAEYVGMQTSVKYDLGKFEKKSLKMEPQFKMTSANADQLFVYLLEQNNLFRVATTDGNYRILDRKEFQSYQFPKIDAQNLKFSFDFYTFEYAIKTTDLKSMLLTIAKKMISKNGRVLENVGENKITIVESGANIHRIIGVFTELDR